MGGAFVAAVIASVGWAYSQQAAAPAKVAPESLLPAKSILFLTTDGGELHEEAWKKTAAYKAIVGSGLDQVGHKLLKALMVQAEMNGFGEEATHFLRAFEHMQDHGLSFAITVDPPQGGPPSGYAIFVMHEGAEFADLFGEFVTDQIQGQLDFTDRDVEGRLVTSAVIPDSPGVEVGWWTEGNHFVLIAGVDAVRSAVAVAAGKSPNITKNPLWEKYIAVERDFSVNGSGWIDLAAIRGMTAGIPLPIPTSDLSQPLTVGKVLELLGLHNLNAIVTQSGYKGEALWSETWIAAPVPRSGLLAIGNDEPVTLDDLPPLPYGLNSFTAGRLDGGKLYDQLLAIIRSGSRFVPDPDAEAQIDAILKEARTKLGFDIRDDLLSSIGGVACAWNDSRQGILGMGAGSAIQVKDPEQIAEIVEKLKEVVERESEGKARLRSYTKHGREIMTLDLLFMNYGAHFCISDGWLVAGSPQVVEAFLLRQDGRLPRWTPDAEYQAALAEFPKEFHGLTVSNPRGTINLLSGLAPLAINFLEIGIAASEAFPKDFDFPLNLEDIPPAELISSPLFPNVLALEITDEGFHYTSRSSFPAVPLVGSDAASVTAVAAVGAALLLPAIQQARMAARQAQSLNNMKQLALAVHNYHGTYNELPPATIPNEELEPGEELSWLVSLLPYLEQAALFDIIDRKQGWESESNELALQTMVPAFINPGAEEAPNYDGYGETHYIGIGGLGVDGPNLPVKNPKAGMFGFNRKTRLLDITDGTSNTLMISEASSTYGAWGAGGYATVRAFTEQPYLNGPDGIGGPFPAGVNMAFGDGSVRRINRDIDPTVLEALTTISGGEAVTYP